MKDLSIEEKAKAYDEAMKKLRTMRDAWNNLETDYSPKDVVHDIEYYFPELAESEDDRIRKKIIATIHLYYGEPLEKEAKEMIAWLEKQAEHANFRNKIQIGDKVTRNEDGVLVNLSQLNRVAKKDEKQGGQKLWSEEDAKTLNRISAILVDASEVKNWWKESRLIEREEMVRLTDFLKSLKDRVQC